MAHLLENKDTILSGLDEDWMAEYDWLQQSLPDLNVAVDKCFQSRFMIFYQFYISPGLMDNGPFQDSYFGILEREKGNSSASFMVVLSELPDLARGGLASSYTSKLIATINSNKPVWDSNVWECLGEHGLRKKTHGNNRFLLAIENYRRLVETTGALVENPDFATLSASFDDTFSRFAHFTDMKKLDLYLWQCGRGHRRN